jgi:hypothetical protein
MAINLPFPTQGGGGEEVCDKSTEIVVSPTDLIELHRNHVDRVRDLLQQQPAGINVVDFNDYFNGSPMTAFIFGIAMRFGFKMKKKIAINPQIF